MKNGSIAVLLFLFSALTSWGQNEVLVRNTVATGPGSISEAIRIANSDPNIKFIRFDPKVFERSNQILIPSGVDLSLTGENLTVEGPVDKEGLPLVTIRSEKVIQTRTGFSLKGAGITVKNLSFVDFSVAGLRVEANAKVSVIENCHFVSNRLSQIEANNSISLVIKGCKFGTNLKGDGFADSFEMLSGIVLNNCRAFSIGENGTGNIFGNFERHAIWVRGGNEGIISENQIGYIITPDGNPQAANIKREAVYLSDTTQNVIIENNIITGSMSHGVLLENAANNVIKGNSIGILPGSAFNIPNQGSGIMLTKGSRFNEIGDPNGTEPNIVKFNMENGVWMVDSGSFSNRIFNNDLSCNGKLGICLRDYEENLVANGRIEPPLIREAGSKSGISGTVPSGVTEVMVFATESVNRCYSCAGSVLLGKAGVNPADNTWVLDWEARFNDYLKDSTVRITAVSVSDDNNTSEFSDCFQFCRIANLGMPGTVSLCGKGVSFDAAPFFIQTNTGDNAGMTYKWTTSEGREVSSTSVLNPKDAGKYVLFMTGCQNTSNLEIGLEVLLSELSITGEREVSVTEKDSIELNITVTGNLSNRLAYNWVPATGLNDPSSPSPLASPSATTTYVITVTDLKSECTATSTVVVIVESPTKTTWGLTPSGSKVEIPASLNVLPDGDVISIGKFTGSLHWDEMPLVTAEGDEELFLLSADSEGNQRFGRKGGGMSVERIAGSAKDSKGNIFITGTFSGSFDFAGEALTAEGPEDIFLISFDSEGNQRFGRKGGGMSVERVAGIVTDSKDNIYITGTFTGAINFDTLKLDADTTSDLFLVSYDSEGNQRFGRKGGGMSVELVSGISIDKNDNLIIGGSLVKSATFGNVNVAGSDAENLFTMQIRSDNLEPVAGMTSKGSSITARNRITQMTTDSEGNLIIAGEYSDNFNLSNEIILPGDTGTRSANLFVAKLQAGTMLPIWGRKFSGISSKSISCICADTEDNIYVGGTFDGIMTAGGRRIISRGGKDFFVSKLNPSGRFMWSAGGGSAGDDSLAAFAADPEMPSLYLTGYAGGNGRFLDRTFNSSTGGSDLFFIKLGPNRVSAEEKLASAGNLTLYPNPSNGNFEVRLPENFNGQIEITDLLGKTVFQNRIKADVQNTASVNLSGVAKGIYGVKLQSGTQSSFGKLIIN